MTDETTTQHAGKQNRLIRALPPFCDVRRGALVWSVAMLITVIVGQWFYYRGISGKENELTAIYFLGGLLAWPFALYFARLFALGFGPVTRFIFAMLSLAGCTLAMTAFIFSQQFRLIFADTHMPITTRIGFYQFAETSASGVFQFLVVGLRLYFPLGILSLLLASLWLARRMR